MADIFSNEHRFAISALSKNNKEYAYEEEILVDKNTSEILIKTPNGDIVSFGYSNRLKSNLDALKNTANYLKIFGNIYSVEFGDTVILPSTVSTGVNYLAESCTLNLSSPESNFKQFILNCDITSYRYEENKLTINELYPEFSLDMDLTFNDNTNSTVNITETSLRLNEKVLKLSDYLSTTDIQKEIKTISFSNFRLTGKIIDRNGTEILDKTNLRTILYSLFILLES